LIENAFAKTNDLITIVNIDLSDFESKKKMQYEDPKCSIYDFTKSSTDFYTLIDKHFGLGW